MFPIPNVKEKSRLVTEALNEFMAKTGVKNCLIVMSYDEPLALNGDGGVTAQKPAEANPFGMAIKCDGPNMHTAMLSFWPIARFKNFHTYMPPTWRS